ncbi:HTH-type transcriptional activator IlvY [Photobacterium atrarenae]|uniref:HTH-type transcriptional activator IlvY n=1 Tax=Photobacterium atrarenae TaxID=865757 RepID=A0ABY5GEW3_9GAMM|nr:HTH-type transcriptional activator IlvY [Photobacterium atrarenae]UTV27788.1 HTH-type transcriptional activator IlvY [Photobacterium atrarenae]
MDIKHLNYFLHLCDSRNFSKTATAVHISPSALSRIIQRLEDEIGQALFIRNNKAVTLTPAGETLLPVAMQIVTEWQTIKTTLRDDATLLKGKLTLFCSVTASYSHLPDLLARFRQQYPNIEIQLITGDPAQAIEKVLDGSADIAIAAKEDRMATSLAFKPIDNVSLSVIAPKFNPTGTSFLGEQVDWAHTPLILPESGTARTLANQWLAAKHIRPNIYAQISGHEAIVSMVALGYGIGVAPDVVIDNSPVKEKVDRLKSESIAAMELGLCCLKNRAAEPLLKAMFELVG